MEIEKLKKYIDHPYKLLFLTIGGAHLYGAPSKDSSLHFRGAHLSPMKELLGLNDEGYTVDECELKNGVEINLITHDIGKFLRLMLTNDGEIMEYLYSPLVVTSSPGYEELYRLGKICLTRQHADYYSGYAKAQWRIFLQEEPKRVKTLLYLYRALLTGIHLMQKCEIESNLVHLNRRFNLSYIDDLVFEKVSGVEEGVLRRKELVFHEHEVERLIELLERVKGKSRLPEVSSAREDLNTLLLRLRVTGLQKMQNSESEKRIASRKSFNKHF